MFHLFHCVARILFQYAQHTTMQPFRSFACTVRSFRIQEPCHSVLFFAHISNYQHSPNRCRNRPCIHHTHRYVCKVSIDCILLDFLVGQHSLQCNWTRVDRFDSRFDSFCVRKRCNCLCQSKLVCIGPTFSQTIHQVHWHRHRLFRDAHRMLTIVRNRLHRCR